MEENQMKIARATVEKLRLLFEQHGIVNRNLEIIDANNVIGSVVYVQCVVEITLKIEASDLEFGIKMSTEYVRQYFKTHLNKIRDLTEEDCILMANNSERRVPLGGLSDSVKLIKTYCNALSESLGNGAPINSIVLPGLSVADCKKRDLMALLTKLEMAVDWAVRCRRKGYVSQDTLVKLREWYEAIKTCIDRDK
jgi:hypothetical protein